MAYSGFMVSTRVLSSALELVAPAAAKPARTAAVTAAFIEFMAQLLLSVVTTFPHPFRIPDDATLSECRPSRVRAVAFVTRPSRGPRYLRSPTNDACSNCVQALARRRPAC